MYKHTHAATGHITARQHINRLVIDLQVVQYLIAMYADYVWTDCVQARAHNSFTSNINLSFLSLME